jgi:hypothetical protein
MRKIDVFFILIEKTFFGFFGFLCVKFWYFFCGKNWFFYGGKWNFLCVKIRILCVKFVFFMCENNEFMVV